jgi:hypothetical protein
MEVFHVFRKKDTNQIDLVLLKTVNDNIELGILKSVLEDNNIPYIARDYGAGGYMRILSGNPAPFKTDILVEKSAYENAKKLVEQTTFG